MLENLTIKNLTVFPEAELRFGSRLNVFVGENGTGKTHLLKVAYSVIAACATDDNTRQATPPTKSLLQARIATKLTRVCQATVPGDLVRRGGRVSRCDVGLHFSQPELTLAFHFSAGSTSVFELDVVPAEDIDVTPVYLSTAELLSKFPDFVSPCEGRSLVFDETSRDTCAFLGAPLHAGEDMQRIEALLAPLAEETGGAVELGCDGRFYLRAEQGRLEMALASEGARKLGMLCRLIGNGAIVGKGYLFWDEPEAGLNHKLIRLVARSLLDLSATGVQVFIATHSLFLLRELEISLAAQPPQPGEVRFFGLHRASEGTTVQQGDSFVDIGPITALEESLDQSDRFLDLP